MLNQLRNAARSWVGAVFIAVLVLSFSVWGVSDIFRGRVADAVVLAGREPVSTAEFRAAFDSEIAQMSNQSGQTISREMALSLGVDQAVATRLGVQAAIQQHAEELGVTTSNRTVARRLTSIEQFIDPITGEFEPSTYRSILFQNQMTPAQFERDLREQTTQAQLVAPLLAGLRPPMALVEARLAFANERRELATVVIPPSAADDVPEPTDDEVVTFYQERAETYQTPARRALSVVTLRIDDFVADAPVDEELLRSQYEIQAARLGEPERRDLVEIAAPNEETAQAVAERLRAGEEPEAVAADLGLTAPTVYDDALAEDLLFQEAGEAAFALEAGEVGDPVDAGLAWYVIRVDEITPGTAPTFEEARPELELTLARDAAMTLQFDAIDAMQIGLESGAGLERAALAARVPVFSFWPVNARGVDPTGFTPVVLAQAPEVVQAGFELPTTGVTSELRELGENGYFAVRVDEIVPAAARPLEEIEDQVRADLMGMRRVERLTELAEQARTQLDAGASPSEAAQAIGMGATAERSELTRSEPTAMIDPNLLAQAFAVGPGTVITGATSQGGRAVVRVEGVVEPAEIDEAQIEAVRDQLAFEIADDVARLFESELRERYPIRVDQRLVEQALGTAALQ